MAVPSSGELRLYADIWVELAGSQGNNSLNSASVHAGFTTPDAMSDFYGYVDAEAPTVTTSAASSITQTSMTANGNVTSDGGATVTSRGFYFGTNSGAPTSNTQYTAGSGTGAYSRSFTGLPTYTTYYMWAYATNTAGTGIGAQQSATTQVSVPTLSSMQFYANGAGGNPDYCAQQWYSNQSGAYYTSYSVSTVGGVWVTGNYAAHGRLNRVYGIKYVQGTAEMAGTYNANTSGITSGANNGAAYIWTSSSRQVGLIVFGPHAAAGYGQFSLA